MTGTNGESSVNYRLRYIALFGIAAVAFYIAHVVIGGILWIGYSHLSQPISDLTASGAPNRGLMLALTFLYGACSILFALFLLLGSIGKANRPAVVGFSLFLAMHCVSFLYAFFPEDLPGTGMSFGGTMHIAITALIVPLSIGAPIVAGIGLLRASGQRAFGIYSIVTGALILVFGGTTVAAMAAKSSFFGLFERLNIGTLLAWMVALAVRGLAGGRESS